MGAVHIHRKVRNAIGILELADNVHDRLRAGPTANAGITITAAALGHAIDDLGQCVFRRIRWMFAVPVSLIRRAARRKRGGAFGFFQDRLVVTSDITRKKAPPFSCRFP